MNRPQLSIVRRGTIRVRRQDAHVTIDGWELDGPATPDDVEGVAYAREFVGLMVHEKASTGYVSGRPVLLFGGQS